MTSEEVNFEEIRNESSELLECLSMNPRNTTKNNSSEVIFKQQNIFVAFLKFILKFCISFATLEHIYIYPQVKWKYRFMEIGTHKLIIKILRTLYQVTLFLFKNKSPKIN